MQAGLIQGGSLKIPFHSRAKAKKSLDKLIQIIDLTACKPFF